MTSNFVQKFLYENRKSIPHEQNISKVPLMLCYALALRLSETKENMTEDMKDIVR